MEDSAFPLVYLFLLFFVLAKKCLKGKIQIFKCPIRPFMIEAYGLI